MLDTIVLEKTGDEFGLTTIAWMTNGRSIHTHVGEGSLRITANCDELAWLNHLKQRHQQRLARFPLGARVATV